MYKLFIKVRIVGSKSIWDTIRKRKLPTFVNNIKIATMKVESQLVNIKTERKLSRFLITATSKSEIDLSRYLGKYEFSAVPQALFSRKGEILTYKDKSKVATENLKVFAT